MKLLLSPYKINEDLLLLEAVELVKNATGSDIVSHPPTAAFLRKEFPKLPKEARDAISFFTKSELLAARAEMARNGSTAPEYRRQALLRKAYDQFLALKPFLGLCSWMHRQRLETGRFQTAPCSISPFRPLLEFSAEKEGNSFRITSTVQLYAGRYPLNEFRRYEFLLSSGNEYFILPWREYQTLKWLEALQWPMSSEELQTQVVSRLTADYRVDTKQLIPAERIETEPQYQVLLSEISNNFLVLTPQWRYDGLVTEGPFQELVEFNKAGKTYLVVRNKEREDYLRSQIENMHPNFARQLNGYYYLSFADAQKKQWFARAFHELLDQEIDVIGMDMLKHFRFSAERIQTIIRIAEQDEKQILLDVDISFGKEKVSLSDLQKILWAGQKAVLLKDGSLGLLGDDWISEYGMLLKHGKVDKKRLRVGAWMLLNGKLDTNGEVLKKEWWRNWEKWRAGEEGLYPVPAALSETRLRPYQLKGYEWMRLLSSANAGGCLADDMGLGKTLQTITYLASRSEELPRSTHLVVCPSSLMYNWQQELARCAPGLPVIIYHGTNRQSANLEDTAGKIIITSYGTLRSDIELLQPISFDSIIADESHTIKNPASLTAKAIYSLSSRSRFALSGTPIMNNTFDLFGQFQYLLPGMFGSREFFKREYADPIDRMGDEEKTKALQKLTAPFILRRTKEQVAPELPDKTESILWCEMGVDQRLAYESIRDQIRSNLFLQIKEQGMDSGKLSVLHGILKLRMACNSCELVPDESLFTYESVKTQVLLDELQQLSAQSKALVFSQFTSMLDILERELNEKQIPFLRIDGSTAASQRQQLVNRFNEDPQSPRVFLLSLKAGNAGLNLTAADYVFLFDPWWNRAIEEQAIDRTHRIGQTKNVFAYRMLCRDSIEERILQLQQRKSKVSAELIGQDDTGFIQRLTEDELAFLFS